MKETRKKEKKKVKNLQRQKGNTKNERKKPRKEAIKRERQKLFTSVKYKTQRITGSIIPWNKLRLLEM